MIIKEPITPLTILQIKEPTRLVLKSTNPDRKLIQMKLRQGITRISKSEISTAKT
jgi:hypothetical protein